MAEEFKQCPNGHFYSGVACPYCKTSVNPGVQPSQKTQVFVSGGSIDSGEDAPTLVDSINSGGPMKTKVDGQPTHVGNPVRQAPTSNRTMFGTETEDEDVPAVSVNKAPRYGRKLVGWLVTYSHDELGTDYRLYEGRNTIGRDIDCNITVQDGRMSGKHAVLLYRANKYSLTDSQSSHGTFVNEEDIELESRYLKDGDIIRMGTTVFKFRTSL